MAPRAARVNRAWSLRPLNLQPKLGRGESLGGVMFRVFCGAVAALTAYGIAAAQPAGNGAPPALSAFARPPAVTQAAISPNGQRIAILGGAPDNRTISFTVIDQPGLKMLRLGEVETLGVRWAGDDYALARVAYWDKGLPRADYRLVRTASITPDGKFVAYLLQADAVSSQLTNQILQRVVHGPPTRAIVTGLTLAAGPSHDMNTRLSRKGDKGDMRVLALFSVDPATGRGVQVERGDFDTQDWEVDLSGEARVMYKIDEDTQRRRIYGRPKGERIWKLLQDGEDGREFLGYASADDAFYFATPVDGGVQVVRTRAPGGASETVGQPVKGAEVWLIGDGHRDAVVGLGVSGDQGAQWLDPTFASVHATLAKAFKGRAVYLQSWSGDLSRFLVTVEGADAPAQWFLYDRPRKELSPIGEEYPELAGAALGRTTFFRYKARDGLEIPAYLTLPPGTAAGAKPPLIVMPHGGPSAHDGPGFDYEAHFLASRGYAVLRPQYRGSTGFGAALEKAGKGEWGGKMHTDLLDGVAAVNAQGLADGGRVCIVGASFGGFAALNAAAFHGSSYRCAASISGISDLGVLLGEYGTDFGRDSTAFQVLRDHLREASPEGLAAASPLRYADRVSIPVLLIHGDKDTVVGPSHSRRMAEALKKAGKPVEYVELAGESHSMAKMSSRTRTLEALEAFLAANLPVEQAAGAAQESR